MASRRESVSGAIRLRGSGSEHPFDSESMNALLRRCQDLLQAQPHESFQHVGVNSIQAVRVCNLLQQHTGDSVSLPVSIVYDFASIRHLLRHVVSVPGIPDSGGAQEDLSLVLDSVSRSPCGIERNLWGLCAFECSGDAICESTRWDVPGALSCANYGGFLADAEWFDARRFSISLAEARCMDPQQRVLLESVTPMIEHVESSLGICVGIYSTEFYAKHEDTNPTSSYTATSGILSVASGRISFVFNLHGPCLSLDTACSSALVACHVARGWISASMLGGPGMQRERHAFAKTFISCGGNDIGDGPLSHI